MIKSSSNGGLCGVRSPVQSTGRILSPERLLSHKTPQTTGNLLFVTAIVAVNISVPFDLLVLMLLENNCPETVCSAD